MTLAEPDDAQRRAADGRMSVWVAASAGTGKTTVLTNRVLNLLLGGTAPERILCLTYTKAAAAEMANRLSQRLSLWAVATDTDLRKDIGRVISPAAASVGPERLEQARRLFARVLETPGGMRILTIHAFCQSLLRRFPLEAETPPHFEVMDERSAAEMQAEVQNHVLGRAEIEPALAEAVAEITGHIQEGRFAELMGELIRERGRLQAAIKLAGGLEPSLARLRRMLGLRPGDTEAEIVRAACDSASFDELSLRGAAASLCQSTKSSDRERGEAVADWLAADWATRIGRFDAYCRWYLKADGEPLARLVTKEQAAWSDVMTVEQARLVAVRQRRAAATELAATAALTRLGVAFLDAYQAEKQRRGLLDYDDLILAVRQLVSRPGVSPWVLFKLDGGIDHVLIDEAQDTNPDQWEVAAALTAEFFAGRGTRDTLRTIFAVGDLKQSIFSFQRADPQQFIARRDHFRKAVSQLGPHWCEVPMQTSFRSTKAVLDVVDAVFAHPAAAAGVALDGSDIVHRAHRAGHAGKVELWPALDPPPDEETLVWPLPIAGDRADLHPRLRLAKLIAETIRHWLSPGEMLVSQGRPIRAGDVMVLVPRRGAFFEELLRELKRLEVPVAGADRMVLTEQLAIMDLLALGRFLVLPEDDLTLATVLKSPLVGLDEEQLFELAYGRPRTLWQALRQNRNDWAERAGAMLAALLGRVDFVPPFELYAELLGAGAGRRRLLGRLGPEAADAIDEFLTQALAYERSHVPSMQGFLHWIESGQTDIKRDLDQSGRDEVRIMTVHGSKGLQAPIVFLPDTMSMPAANKAPQLLWHDERTMLWAPGLAASEPMAATARMLAKTRREQEHRRLLYVALTRAEDRLYVAGWNTKKTASDSCWYKLIRGGMALVTHGATTPIRLPPHVVPFDEPGCIHETQQTAQVAERRPEPADRSLTEAGPLPAFARLPAPPEPSPPRPLMASRPSGEDPPVQSPLTAMQDPARFQRGTLIHRLLQTLPGLPPSDADAAARRFLARQIPPLEVELQADIAREVMAVLLHDEFAPLFGPGSRAEVPIVGTIGDQVLSARVDRLVVTPDEIMVIDYKTNRPPPREAAYVSPTYLGQMALYRLALERIYPGRRVRTLLLWTDGPRIMEVGS
jgi:ATP-dependent helicase/nuclease subunit A